MNPDALAARIEHLLGISQSDTPEGFASTTPTIPNHEIISWIGGGSYGDVWLARTVTGALRAVKVVWRSRFGSERPYEREFHGIVQFEPLSRSHPAVVNILHIGRDDKAGFFFYLMELADAAQSGSDIGPEKPKVEYTARTLALELKSLGRLPVLEATALGVQLAGALGHLHRHGLVHRDVKPSNIIFVGGQPKLADIGLVTKINREQSFVGTEGFIPPEGPGSERADLFSLGRLLYEASTGKNRCEFPGLPDDLDLWAKDEREALLELNAVLMRACASEAKKRHSNAAELAGDLNLILAGRSVRRAYRLEGHVRRATIVSFLALALVFAAILSNWLLMRQKNSSEASARRERALRERAENAERDGQQQLYVSLLEQARASVLSGELGQRVRALDAVRRAGAISNSAALRGSAVAALALPDMRFERDWPLSSDVTLVQLDPGFKRIALCSNDGPVEIRSMSDRSLLASLPASVKAAAYVAVWSSDGRFLAVKRDLETQNWRVCVEVWDVAAGRQVLFLRGVTRSAISFHPQLPRLIVGVAPKEIAIWDLEMAEEVARYSAGGEVALVRVSPDGESLAALRASGQEWAITVLRTADGTRTMNRVFTDVTPDYASDFAWHPTERALAVGDRTGGVHLMDVQTGETRVLGRHKAAAVTTEFAPDGRHLFTGGWDREIVCWDMRTLLRAFTIPLDSYRLQFRQDGHECAILRWPETLLQLHTFEKSALYREFGEDLGGGRISAAFSPNGRWLAACGNERLVVWDLASPGPGAIVSEEGIRRIAFSPQNELFASRIGAGFRWHVAAGIKNDAPPTLGAADLTNTKGLISLCLDSNAVFFTGDRGTTRVALDHVSVEAEAWTATVDGLNGVSPDGRWLGIFRSQTAELYVHRLPGLELAAVLTNQTPISFFEFSPAGNEIAVASRVSVEFWSTTNWQRTRCITNFTSVVYAPDDKTLLLSAQYRSAGLYNAQTMALLMALPPGTLPLALSANGQYLAAATNDRRIQVWDLRRVRRQLRELGLDWDDTRAAIRPADTSLEVYPALPS